MTDAGGYIGEAQRAARETKRVNCKVRKGAPPPAVSGFDDRAHFDAINRLAGNPMAMAVALVGVELVRAFVARRPRTKKRRRLK